MRTRLICVALGLLSIPALASADDHRWDGYLGGSGGTGGSKLGGIHQSLGITAWKNGVLSKVSFVVDWSTQVGKDVTQFAYTFGGRAWFSKGDWKTKPFAELLYGVVRQSDGLASPNDGSLKVGFGVDFVPDAGTRGNAIGYRVAVDRFTRFDTAREDFWRISGGVVYRFGQHGQ